MSAWLLFAVGHVLSASAFFTALGGLGGLVAPRVQPLHQQVVIMTMVVLMVAEAVSILLKQPYSFGLRRQTPRNLGRSPLGVVIWGIDTGTPISTIRHTLLPVMAMSLTLLGVGGGLLVGLAYSTGFVFSVAYFSSAAAIEPRPSFSSTALAARPRGLSAQRGRFFRSVSLASSVGAVVYIGAIG